MDSTSIAMLVALVALVAMSGYFSATETAFTSLNRIRLKNKADNGDRRAARTLELAEDYDRLLSTILIGNNIVNNVATTIGAVLFIKLIDDVRGPTVSAIVLTVVILIFGEVSPKSLAKENPEGWAMIATPLLRLLVVILTPANFLFTQWKRLLSKVFRTAQGDGITEEELVGMVDQAENEGGLDQHESDLIRNAIEFNDLEVSEILTPRVDLVAVPDTATMEQAASLFVESGYSRLPIYHDSIDNIVGVIHEKDFNAARYHGETKLADLKAPVLYTTGNTKISELLRILQKNKAHMAVVVDEYGGTGGLLTLEDLLEELVGKIYDEFDPQEEQDIIRVNNTQWRVSGSADLEDLAEAMGLELPEDELEELDCDTVGGLVFALLPVIPEDGSRPVVEAMGLRIRVEELWDRRVEWALAEKAVPADGEND